jgi:hypothetical protein
MVLDVVHEVNVAHDLEVKAPGIIHASLPKVAGFVVFFAWSEG